MRKRRGPIGGAPGAAFLALLALYAATGAPDVTFWDAGEFVAAFHTLGIPHPPGTPLVVLLGRTWEVAFGWLGEARAAALLAGACTAAAGGLTAALFARWTGSALAGVAAALCAGATSTVWANATEAEAYAPALLLALAAVASADRAGRDEDDRWLALACYLLGLAVPLHLSALVAAPAAVLLAATRAQGRLDRSRATLVGGAALLAAAAGRVSVVAAVAAVALLLGAAVVVPRARPRRVGWGTVARVASVVAVGISAALVLIVRARHDPALNQGDPSTWSALADVLARRQYAVAAPWPRQAPPWLQLANLFEWADWQFAYGVAPGAPPSVLRTSVTAAYALLGVLGAAWHRRCDRRSFRATATLLVAGSVGVAAYLNLRAGPSFGWGVIPDDAPREARERDYFFVLAWWVWGAWAALGAFALAARWRAATSPGRRWGATAAVIAAAEAPVALNWRTATRRAAPEARLAPALARLLLDGAPPRAVLLVNGDNDTYPLWYAQQVRGVRRDVTVVTVPLLGATWYRRELARRDTLLERGAAEPWYGERATVGAIAAGAARAGRPLAVSAATRSTVRDTLGGRWRLTGAAFVRVGDGDRPGVSIRGLAFDLDTVAARRLEASLDLAALAPLGADADGVARWAHGLLRCPSLALRAARASADGDAAASLDATCNRK
jgi:hypothetical protein